MNKLTLFLDKTDSYEHILDEVIHSGWNYTSNISQEDKLILCVCAAKYYGWNMESFDLSSEILEECFLHCDGCTSSNYLLSEIKKQYIDKAWDDVFDDLAGKYESYLARHKTKYANCDDLDLHRAMAKSYKKYESDFT